MIKSFTFRGFSLRTHHAYIEFAFVAMEGFLGDRGGTNIAKRIVFRFEVVFDSEGMIFRALVGFVSFAFGAVIKFTLFTTPSDSGLALLDSLVADDTDFVVGG